VNILNLNEVSHFGSRTQEIAIQQSLVLTHDSSPIVGREVGDDRVDLSRHVLPLVTTLMAQEELVHMVTSWPDTSVRKKSWNFCEVTGGPPTDPSMGFDHIRKNGDFTNLGYNDSIVLRIILDVQKGDGEEHSSTEPGKMSMLGSRLATPRRELRGIWMLASLFQDAMLCTHKASEPKYLPQIMGGTGVTALFDNPNNVFLYVLSYKGGAYRRIYATACSEMRDYLYRLERDVQSAPILCPRLREKQEYFWGTYDNMVFVPREKDIHNSLSPPPALYERTGGQNRFQAFEDRLVRTRHIVTRRQAQVEWSHSRRLHSIFNGVFPHMKDFEALDKERSKTQRARYDGALSANSALQNLLRREASRADAIKLMGSENFLTVTTGERDFTRADALWVYMNGQGENYSLRDVSLSEDMFVREEVSAEETFKVGGLPLRTLYFGGRKLRQTKTKVGLYQISSTMEEWAEDLLNRLLDRRAELQRPLKPVELSSIFLLNPEWVNDDTGLIAKCLEDVTDTSIRVTVGLVSGDRKLANKMANTCNVQVMRIDPQQFVISAYKRGQIIDHSVDPSFLAEMGVKVKHVYIDTGSISASAVNMVEEDGEYFHRTVRSTGWVDGTRTSSITLVKMRRNKLKAELHKQVQRPRLWRQTSRPGESVYSSHSSWKTARSKRSEESEWWRPGEVPPLPARNVQDVPGAFPLHSSASGRK